MWWWCHLLHGGWWWYKKWEVVRIWMFKNGMKLVALAPCCWRFKMLCNCNNTWHWIHIFVGHFVKNLVDMINDPQVLGGVKNSDGSWITHFVGYVCMYLWLLLIFFIFPSFNKNEMRWSWDWWISCMVLSLFCVSKFLVYLLISCL